MKLLRILILLILLPLFSQGQIVRTHPYYKPAAVSGCSYLLDQYSGAAAAYSLRQLDCDYAGSAIRVRRSSDNTEQDIGFTSGGDLDTSALKTFVGTGGTDDGFVVTWYDQSGNVVNATQSTSSAQPQIMDNGVILRKNGYVAMYSDGSNDQLNFSMTVNSNLIYTFAIASRESGGTSERLLGFAANSTSHDWIGTAGFAAMSMSANYYNYRNTSMGGSISYTTGTRYVLYSYINGTELGVSLNNGSNNTAPTSSTAMNATAEAIYSAPWATTNAWGRFYCSEMIIYRTDQSSNKSGINSNINTYWGVY